MARRRPKQRVGYLCNDDGELWRHAGGLHHYCGTEGDGSEVRDWDGGSRLVPYAPDLCGRRHGRRGQQGGPAQDLRWPGGNCGAWCNALTIINGPYATPYDPVLNFVNGVTVTNNGFLYSTYRGYGIFALGTNINITNNNIIGSNTLVGASF